MDLAITAMTVKIFSNKIIYLFIFLLNNIIINNIINSAFLKYNLNYNSTFIL